MKFEEIESRVRGVPYIIRENAKFLYDLIVTNRLTRILELGIAHGTASCYMAAALDELGGGFLTCVDLIAVKDAFKPSAEEQLGKTGLSKYAEVVRMQTGYTWFLHDEIRKHTQNGQCEPVYDLCIIDGPKNWTIDGAAFFMADKLLKQGAWLIFDDYNWTYASAEKNTSDTDGITHRTLSDPERQTAHVREIFELLVKQHPSYSNLVLFDEGDWALAQKTAGDAKTYTLLYRNDYSSKHLVNKALHRLVQKGKQWVRPSGS